MHWSFLKQDNKNKDAINNDIFYCVSKLNGKNTKVMNEGVSIDVFFQMYLCGKFL